MASSVLFYLLGGLDAYSLPKYAAAAFLLAFWAPSERPRYSAVQHPAIGFLFCLGLSATFAKFPAMAFWGQHNAYTGGVFPSLLVLAAFNMGHGKDAEKIGAVLVSVCCLSALVCILQYAFGACSPFPLLNGRAYGTLGSPAYEAGLLGIAAVVALSRGWYAAIALLLAGVYTTQSRIGFLAFAVGAGILLLLSRRYLLALCLAGAVSVAGILASSRTVNHFQSDRMRVLMASVAWDAFKSSPLIGVGPEHFMWELEKDGGKRKAGYMAQTTTNAHCHNAALETLMSTGVLGSCCLLAVFVLLALELHKSRQNDGLAVLGAVLAYGCLQPMVLPLKLVFALFFGASVEILGRVRKPMQLAYASALALVALSLLPMLYATRTAYYAALVGDRSALERAYKHFPPMLEKYWKPRG